MTRAAAKGVAITYGFVSVLADLYTAKATDSDASLTQLCNGRGTHDPIKPSWPAHCPQCGPMSRADLVKGVEVAKDTYVVFGADEVKDLKSDDDAYKGKLALFAHDAVEVESSMFTSGSNYQLVPSKGDQFYGLLREMLLDTPDLAYVGKYTPRTRASRYRVRPLERKGRTLLIAEQLIAPSEVSEAPEFTTGDVPQQMRDMALQVARGFVTPFDPDTYEDAYKARLAAEVEARAATGGVGAIAAVTPLPQPAGMDPMAAMAAQMQAFLASNGGAATPPAPTEAPIDKPKPVRKRTAKPKVDAA